MKKILFLVLVFFLMSFSVNAFENTCWGIPIANEDDRKILEENFDLKFESLNGLVSMTEYSEYKINEKGLNQYIFCNKLNTVLKFKHVVSSNIFCKRNSTGGAFKRPRYLSDMCPKNSIEITEHEYCDSYNDKFCKNEYKISKENRKIKFCRNISRGNQIVLPFKVYEECAIENEIWMNNARWQIASFHFFNEFTKEIGLTIDQNFIDNIADININEGLKQEEEKILASLNYEEKKITNEETYCVAKDKSFKIKLLPSNGSKTKCWGNTFEVSKSEYDVTEADPEVAKKIRDEKIEAEKSTNKESIKPITKPEF